MTMDYRSQIIKAWIIGLVIGTCIQSSTAQDFAFVNYMQDFKLYENLTEGNLNYFLTTTGSVGDVEYFINKVGDQKKDVFGVNQFTGQVRLIEKVDRETDRTVFQKFKALDRGNRAEITADVTLSVLDINDVPPRFTQDTMKETIPEDTAVETTISYFDVTDIDYENDDLSVRCDNSSQYIEVCKKFKIVMTQNSNQNWAGYVLLVEPVDYEVQSLYQIPLIAFDGIYSTPGSIEVTLLNLQDTPPRFIYAVSITVEEGLPPDSYLTYVRAVDGDVDNPRDIRYNLAFRNQLVSLDAVSGNITTNVTFDRESPDLIIGYIDLGIEAREVINATSGELGSDASTTAYTTIRITVLDANDNRPTFTTDFFNVSISEDIPNESPLPFVSLTVADPDLGDYSYFEFELSAFGDVFKVSPEVGQGQTTGSILVKDTNKINYETGPRVFEFDVIARETKTKEGNAGKARVVVYVTDVNNNLPVFNPPNYQARINETATGGIFVVQVIAFDPDSGNFGKAGIRFDLIGDGSNLFNIGAVSGIVTVANCPTPGTGDCIDYEKKKKYDLTVTARDDLGTGQPVTSNLEIFILDVNDYKPQFVSKRYISYIVELQTQPDPEVIVSAIDLDSVATQISYSLIDATDKWQINEFSGKITAKNPILYLDAPGANGSFIMTAQATDGMFVDTAEVIIYVRDINNHAPEFEIGRYYERISENTPPNDYVLTVKATDKDSPTTEAGKIQYSLFNTSGLFTIGQKTGEIFTSTDALFDYDAKDKYFMTVLAIDQGQPSLTGTSSVTIEITDENNKDPFFVSSIMKASVYENVAIGHSVLTATSQDPDDNSILQHFFVEPISANTPEGVKVNRQTYDYTKLFIVNQDGLITTNRSLNRDSAALVTLTIHVVDVNANPRQTGTGTVIINILEYNDQPPYFLPYTNITIVEERPKGSFVMPLLASDDDDQIAEYQLIYNPGNYFSIGFQTGVLSVNNRIDFEKVEKSSIIALVYDTGVPRLSASTTVYVTVININDNPPIFTQASYTARISEGAIPGLYVATVKANDADKGDYGVVRYQLNDPRFLINATTGDIVVAPGAKLDREATPQITIPVTAYDSPLDPSVRKYTEIRLYITLDDINDNPPIFRQADYFATIIETVPIGIQVLRVFADDADIGFNAEIAYRISNNSGDPLGLFSIAEKSGRIRVAKSLLRNYGVYTFVVSATDQDGTGPFTATANVQITVLEATNSPPKWIIPTDQNKTVPVLESQYLGMVIYDVHAEDVDRGDNGVIDYGFFIGQNFTNQTKEFQINSITGVISARIVFDREQVDRYVLLLIARDRGTPTALDATRYLTIRIKDVNDNIPKFPQQQDGSTRPYEFVISENVQVGDPVGQPVEATDADENPKIYYYIIGGDGVGKFGLNRDTGQLVVASPIDSEQQNEYYLDIRATNNVSDYSVITSRKKRALSPDIVRVLISVRNTNDAPPVFQKQSYTGCISTRAPIGHSIVTIKADDKDSPGGVSYVIKSGNTNEGLVIGASSGTIYNKKLMADFISSGVNKFNLNVEATDNQLTDSTDVLVFITQEGNEVELLTTQPPIEVRQFQDQFKTTLESLKDSNGIPLFKFVCISSVKYHVTSAEQQESYWSDVYTSAINNNNYIYTSEELKNILTAEMEKNRELFEVLYVKSIDVADDEPTYLDDTPALVVMIIIAILFFFTILFVIIAAYCIWNSKQKKKKALHIKRMRERNNPEPIASINPMYDNRGFVPDDPPRGFIIEDDPQHQYAKVQKTFIDDRPQEPIPQPESEPEITGPEAIDAVIFDNDDGNSDESSPTASPHTPRRPVEDVDDFMIETEVVDQ